MNPADATVMGPVPGQPPPHIEMRVRVNMAMLGLLREFVTSVARHLGFPEDQTAQIEMCVDEACANAIEHAYRKSFDAPEDPDHPHELVAVEIFFSGEELTIRVVDNGLGAESGAESRMRDLEQYIDANRESYRGLGFHLINQFMDRVDVRTAPGLGTTVEMTKFRR